ncbi:MAG: tyrosine-protein phosphatase [Roseiflexaceae bacterium]|jgi:protein-tyrosine phosphatase|nr:tyrosine-protein phosphatase [Chloroflexaceae bacterium]
MSRAIELAGIYNMRDLGGLRCMDGRETRYGIFVRGDSPHQLTAASLTWLHQYGITEVLDLRSTHERRQLHSPFEQHADFHYTHIPLRVHGLRAYDLRQLTELERYYLTMLETDQVQFATLFRLLATHPAGLFFHCRIGKDRTGLVAAMILAMVGVAYDDIVADYTLTTPRITPLVARYQAERPFYISQQLYEDLFVAHARVMQRVLNELTVRYGGAAGYCQAIGVPEVPALLTAKLTT